MPTKGVFTSGFGYRWGVLHAGIDIAGPIGTPISPPVTASSSTPGPPPVTAPGSRSGTPTAP